MIMKALISSPIGALTLWAVIPSQIIGITAQSVNAPMGGRRQEQQAGRQDHSHLPPPLRSDGCCRQVVSDAPGWRTHMTDPVGAAERLRSFVPRVSVGLTRQGRPALTAAPP